MKLTSVTVNHRNSFVHVYENALGQVLVGYGGQNLIDHEECVKTEYPCVLEVSREMAATIHKALTLYLHNQET